MTLTETIDRFPPCLARIVARDPKHLGRRLSLAGLAKASGLSYGIVRRLSNKRTWANTPPSIIDKFTAACGLDILHPKRKIYYLKRVLKQPHGYRHLASVKGKHPPKFILAMLEGLEI